MRAIVVSQSKKGAYLLDNTGSFHISERYRNLPVGTEVILKKKCRCKKRNPCGDNICRHEQKNNRRV